MLFRNDLDDLLAFEARMRKATTETAEIVKGVRCGRINRLFLSDGRKLRGFFNESEGRVVVHCQAIEGDDDLLDCAALMTPRQSGNVTLVDPGRLPPDGRAAAILRY